MPSILTTTDVPWGWEPEHLRYRPLCQLADLQRELRFGVLGRWPGVEMYAGTVPTCDNPAHLPEVCRDARRECDDFLAKCEVATGIVDAIGPSELDRLVYPGAAADLDVLLRQACQHAEKVAHWWDPEHPNTRAGAVGEWQGFVPALEDWMRRAATGGKFAAAELTKRAEAAQAAGSSRETINASGKCNMDIPELARALRRLADRFRRVAQSSATDEAANVELGALNEQGGRLYCEGGKLGLTEWPLMTITFTRPGFDLRNPFDFAAMADAYQDVWCRILPVMSQLHPHRIPGGFASGGGIYEVLGYDDEFKPLGVWTFPPERWRHWAGDSAELADLLAERLEAESAVFNVGNPRELCGEWERIAREIHNKGPESAEAKRLVVLSDLIRDSLRVRCIAVDAEAMAALATIRETVARLPPRGADRCGSEVTTPLAEAFVAVRALGEHADRADAAGLGRVADDKQLDKPAELATDEKPRRTAKLPKLQKHDMQAWRLQQLKGWTQEEIADALNREFGTTYTQGQVSRMIKRAKKHAEASGIQDLMPKPIARPRGMDSARLELGARVDKRRARPSDLAGLDDGDDWN